MTIKSRTRIRVAAAVAGLWLLAAGGARADVAFEVDKETLNRILAEVSLDRVAVPISPQRSITVRLEKLHVTGLDPAAGEGGRGYILTSMMLRAPDLGVSLRVEPRISLDVVDEDGEALLELRFEQVPLKLPIAGTINLAPLIPPLRYPTDNAWLLAGARGDVPIISRLSDVRMGREALRFVFEVEVQSPLGGKVPATGAIR
jgi:hypothetical protein